MNYYKIAPLRLNLPPLIYKSNLALQKNSIIKICVKNKNALGIVLDSAKKPNFECLEAVESEFYLTQNQAVLGRFIASYYCVNEGVAFGIMTLGNSPLGLHSADLVNFGRCADFSLALRPKFTKNHESQTENPSVVDSAQGAESSNKIQSKKPIKSFCYFWLSPKVESSLPLNPNLPNNADSAKQNLDNLNSCEAPENSPASWCKKSDSRLQKCNRRFFARSGKSEALPLKAKSGSFWRVGGAGWGVQPFCEKESKLSGENSVRVAESSVDSANLQISQNLPKLSHPQQCALDFILSHDKTLLFGDTGSGKTEIYANAIYETLAQGKNVLFLMPEIALTPQMERRLKHIFGDFVCIWHSKISKAKKEQILANLDSANCEGSAQYAQDSAPFTQDFKKTQIKIIVGARSALFLPLSNIGLIIVDEEHDEAYKSTSAPRYNARDLAIFLAQKQGIRLVLGSATPSLNSYYNFGRENAIFRLRGGYFQGKKSVSFDSEILSPNLLEKIRIVLENRKQIIVFVPLRGNFKVLQCVSCGCGIKCENCAVNMSLHSKRNALICHYCGFAKPFFNGKTKCQNCPSVEFSALKIGTQEICKQLQSHFSRAKIAIFDRDEVKSDSKMRKILGEFNDGKIDILVGTQMISKGHDYHNVALVAILGIDGVLNSSDFRAYERALSLLTQISGRTARKNDGEVVINTRNREFFTPFLNDYEAFLRFELENRKNLYPPFRRLALLIAQNKDESKAKEILQNAKKIVESAQKKVEIVGLNKAPIERINGLWRYFLLLRATSAKELLGAIALCKNLPLIIDIDPQQVF